MTDNLANKFRPKRWEQVAGQARYVNGLRNAAKAQKLPAVALFAGPSGTGKTTLARIMGQSAMCKNWDTETGNGCGTCNDCRSLQGINDGPNFMHIDGSGGGLKETIEVDLAQFLRSAPVGGARCKFAIIDEVQAASGAAFNALLTLTENMPSTSKVAFTTTHPEDVGRALMTRSTKFWFSAIPSQMMVDAAIAFKPELKDVAAGLAILADASEGSMRELWTLLEQHSTMDEPLTADLANWLAGGARDHDRAVLWQAVWKGNFKKVQDTFKAIVDGGAQPIRLTDQLLQDLFGFSAKHPDERDWTRPIEMLSRARVLKDPMAVQASLLSMGVPATAAVKDLNVADLATAIGHQLRQDPAFSLELAERMGNVETLLEGLALNGTPRQAAMGSGMSERTKALIDKLGVDPRRAAKLIAEELENKVPPLDVTPPDNGPDETSHEVAIPTYAEPSVGQNADTLAQLEVQMAAAQAAGESAEPSDIPEGDVPVGSVVLDSVGNDVYNPPELTEEIVAAYGQRVQNIELAGDDTPDLPEHVPDDESDETKLREVLTYNPAADVEDFSGVAPLTPGTQVHPRGVLKPLDEQTPTESPFVEGTVTDAPVAVAEKPVSSTNWPDVSVPVLSDLDAVLAFVYGGELE